MLQKEEPGRHFKKSAETFYATKKLKITVKFCRGWFIMQCYGMWHVIETTFSALSFEFFSWKDGDRLRRRGEGLHQDIFQKEKT